MVPSNLLKNQQAKAKSQSKTNDYSAKISFDLDMFRDRF